MINTRSCAQVNLLLTKMKRYFDVNIHRAIFNAITPTNHKKRKQHNGPIRTRSKCMQPAPSAGKSVRARHDWFCFCFSLVEKVGRVCQLITERSKEKPKQTRNFFRHSIENRSTPYKIQIFFMGIQSDSKNEGKPQSTPLL